MSGAASALAAGNAGGEGGQQGGGTPTPTPAPSGGDKPWFQEAGIDAKYHDAIQSKGWGGLDDILDSYTNVEKLVSLERGGDVDRILVRPKADATPDEVAAFRQKAGFSAPADAKEYGFGDEAVSGLVREVFDGTGIPEDTQKLFAQEMTPVVEKATAWMQQAGVPKDVAGGLVKAVLADEAKALSDYSVNSDKEYQTLSQQMGDGFKDFEEAGRRAVRAAGLDAPTLDRIERAIGTKTMMEMFGKFGKTMGEMAAPSNGNDGGSGGGGGFTPTAESAQAKITKLRSDSDFQARLLSTNPQVRGPAQKEWEELHRQAYPS